MARGVEARAKATVSVSDTSVCSPLVAPTCRSSRENPSVARPRPERWLQLAAVTQRSRATDRFQSVAENGASTPTQSCSAKTSPTASALPTIRLRRASLGPSPAGCKSRCRRLLPVAAARKFPTLNSNRRTTPTQDLRRWNGSCRAKWKIKNPSTVRMPGIRVAVTLCSVLPIVRANGVYQCLPERR